MLGRLGARRAGARSGGGVEPGVPPGANAASAGPGATAAAPPPPLRRHTKDGAGGRCSALSRRPAARAPASVASAPSPASFSGLSLCHTRGAPGRRSPGRAAAPRDLGRRAAGPPSRGPPPRGRSGSQARAGGAPPPRSPGPSLPSPTPTPGVPDTARRGAVPGPGGRAREGGGPPIKIQREDGEKQRRPSAAHLACRRRAARLPGPRLLRPPAPPRPRARKDSCRGHPANTRPGKLCRIRPLERLSARLPFLHSDCLWLSPEVVAGAFTQPPENLRVSESFCLPILVKLAIESWEGLFLRQTARLLIGRRWHPLRRLQ